MGKGTKKGKKPKSAKGPQIHEGVAEFMFSNGDKYDGGYCAHVSGLVWRQGHGIYTTNDGQIYEGQWKDDKLNEQENLQISFQNEDKFAGKVKKYKYHGPGTYFFKNGARLICDFHDNKPFGEMVFMDHRGFVWNGNSIEGDNVLLFKELPFSSELDSERGKGIPKYRDIGHKQSNTLQLKSNETRMSSVRLMEKLIFAKTKQTLDDIDFENSDWSRDFKKYQQMYKTVMRKLTTDEGDTTNLNENEREWYDAFLESADILQKRKDKILPEITCDLLERFHSMEYRNSCPPVRVFYPRPVKQEDN